MLQNPIERQETGDRLVELKEGLKALAKNINQENEKLLGHFYQLKETAFELKAYTRLNLKF